MYFTSMKKTHFNWELLLASSSSLLNYAGPYHIRIAWPRRRVIASSVSLGFCHSPFNMLILSTASWFHLIFTWVRIISAARTFWINSCCVLYSRFLSHELRGNRLFFLLKSVFSNFYVPIDRCWISIFDVWIWNTNKQPMSVFNKITERDLLNSIVL